MAQKQNTLRLVVLVLLAIFALGYIFVALPWAAILMNTTYLIGFFVLLIAVLLGILWILRKQGQAKRRRR